MDNYKNANDHGAWLSSLHGLRALAIIAVLLAHTANTGGIALGNVGVAVFYSLSGFLAYYVLFHDEKKLGRIDYNYFLMRRILRIWPAYFFVIALATWLATEAAYANADYVGLFTFTENWGMAAFATWPLPTLSPLWSISVEFQFYIVAPFIYRLLRSRHAFIFCVSIILLSNYGRYFYVVNMSEQSGNGGLYYLTYSYIDTFVAGALVAHWFLSGRKINAYLQWLAFGLSILLIRYILILWGPIIFPPYAPHAILPYMLLPLAVGLLLISNMPMQKRTLYTYVLSTWPFAIIGTLSYSIYLLHLLVAHYLQEHGLFILYSVCFVGAGLIYFLIERPFLRLKNKLKGFTARVPWPAILVCSLCVVGTVHVMISIIEKPLAHLTSAIANASATFDIKEFSEEAKAVATSAGEKSEKMKSLINEAVSSAVSRPDLNSKVTDLLGIAQIAESYQLIDQAETIYLKVLEISPNQLEALKHLGYINMEKHQWLQALGYMNAALGQDTNDEKLNAAYKKANNKLKQP